MKKWLFSIIMNADEAILDSVIVEANNKKEAFEKMESMMKEKYPFFVMSKCEIRVQLI